VGVAVLCDLWALDWDAHSNALKTAQDCDAHTFEKCFDFS